MSIFESPQSAKFKERHLSRVSEDIKSVFISLEHHIGELANQIEARTNQKSFTGYYLPGDRGTFVKLQAKRGGEKSSDRVKVTLSPAGPWRDPRNLLRKRKDGPRWWCVYLVNEQDLTYVKDLVSQAYLARKRLASL
jgi:hypothetical protein